MSQWDESVRNHPIWNALAEFGPAVDHAIAEQADHEECQAGLHRLKALLAFVGKRLNGTDPNLIPTEPLDKLLGNFNDARAEISAFLTDSAAGHINGANGHLNTALINLAQINSPITSDEIGALKDAADQYRQAMEANSAKVSEVEASLLRDASGVRDDYNKLRTEIDASFANLGNQSSTELEKLRGEIDAEKSRADGVVTTFTGTI